MPAYITRWPDASFSIVVAPMKGAALAMLNSFDKCMPADVHQMSACSLHLQLSDHGQFVLDLQVDHILSKVTKDETVDSILALYPHLARIFGDEYKHVSFMEWPAHWRAAVCEELADAERKMDGE